MVPNGQEYHEKNYQVPRNVLLLLGHKIGHEDTGNNIDLVGGADKDEGSQQDVHQRVIWNEDQNT